MINLIVVCKSYFDQCQELYSNCCVLNMHTFITEILESVYKNDMKSLLHSGDWELRWKWNKII